MPLESSGIARAILRSTVQFSELAGRLASPVLLLGARLWLSQVVFVHRIMAMMESHGAHAVPSGLDTLTQSIAPVLLAAGLLTRPVALGLLVETMWAAHADATLGTTGPRAVLLVWLLIIGAGPLSIDFPLRRGLSWIPSRLVRALGAVYAWMGRVLAPLMLLAVRMGLAAAMSAFWIPALHWSGAAVFGGLDDAMGQSWWLTIVAVALALGYATRMAALVSAAAILTAGIASTADDRIGSLLLVLLLGAAGAGLYSVDRWIARWLNGPPPRDVMADEALPRVVVIGGGFAGIAATQGLSQVPCRVTLIDRRNYHLFQPLLYQVATAALSPADIATPIRSMFRSQRNVRVHLGEVTSLDINTRDVVLGAERIPYDYLVLATGAQHSYFGQDDWARFAPGLKSIEDATAIRSRLLRAFEEAENTRDPGTRAAWLTFVIVGGGPTGIELAGALAELARHGLDQEYRSIDPAMARVILVQSGPRILPSFAPVLSAAAERSLRALGVEIRLNAKVRNVDAGGVDVADQRIAAHTVLWAAGVAASPAARWVGLPGDAAGRLAVEPDLSVPGLSSVYAVGDTAASRGWRGELVPGLAPAAKQQGRYVAQIISAAITGRPAPQPFRYQHLGSLATVGRLAAVVELGRLRLWGEPAWWFWGAAHVTFLVGGRNKLRVVTDWFWAYLTYRRSTRLITNTHG